jgi:ArsR family transcriptional regulator
MYTPAMSTTLPADLTRTARLFHALADETRLGILGQLVQGERCVCELTGPLDAAQSRLSFHLKTMKDAGVLESRKEGRWVYYRINPEALEAITAVVSELAPAPVAGHRQGQGTGCCA